MKIKICPDCGHKNVSFASRCEKCGGDITKESVFEVPSLPPETVSDYKIRKFLIYLVILAVIAVAYLIIRLFE